MRPMLVELTVRNFAVIEETRLDLGRGFSTVTGETGAGKSLLVDALEFVLGGTADRDLIRAGASSASVEAVFHATPGGVLSGALAAHGIEADGEDTLVLARETHREGRTVSRLNGRAVPAVVVRDVGAALVDVHGQGSHLSLLDQRFQLAALDAHAGLTQRVARMAEAAGSIRHLQDSLATLGENARLAAHQRELLAFQASEIHEADIQPGEETKLRQERELLANASIIQEACSAAYDQLFGGGSNAADLLAEAVAALRRAPDPTGMLAARIDALEGAAAQVIEAARDIRDHGEDIAGDPARLQEIEARIETLRRLKGKYGDTEEAVIAFGAEAADRLSALDEGDERRVALETQLANAEADAAMIAWELSSSRRNAIASMIAGAESQLADLGLERVRFDVSMAQRTAVDGLPGPDGERYAFTGAGVDDVTFMVETNTGEGLRPLARIASGGETARMMLALKSALHGGSGVPTLVFDEIDSGVGGRAADVVGRKLWALARDAQVLCVTHLPQIAAYADRHFRVAKATDDERTYAAATPLSEEERAGEIAAMIGGAPTQELHATARQMLEAAAATKAGGG